MKKAFEVYGMSFMATEKAVTGDPKVDTLGVNQVLETYQPKNGHYRSIVTRPLTDMEKALIKRRFLKLGGIIKEDATKVLKRYIPYVSIFQIVGTVNNLHRQVQAGTLQVKNPAKYDQHIKAKRMMWASWASPKYQALRNKILGFSSPKPCIGTPCSHSPKIVIPSRPRGRPPYFTARTIAFAYPSMGV